MRLLKALGPALLVSTAFSLWLVFFLGSGWLFAIGSSSLIGLGILAVIASRPTDADRLADAAWRAAAPDLPPVSDRRALEQTQDAIPGPDESGGGARARSRRDEATQAAIR